MKSRSGLQIRIMSQQRVTICISIQAAGTKYRNPPTASSKRELTASTRAISIWQHGTISSSETAKIILLRQSSTAPLRSQTQASIACIAEATNGTYGSLRVWINIHISPSTQKHAAGHSRQWKASRLSESSTTGARRSRVLCSMTLPPRPGAAR